MWSKDTNKTGQKDIKRIAGEIDWDTGKAQGVPSDYVSKKLYAELLEQKASHIIKYINTNKTPELTFLEASTLSVFLAHQIVRVPRFRINLNKFLSLGFSKGLITIDDLGNKQILADKVVKNTIKITHKQFSQNIQEIKIKGTRQQESLLSLLIATDIAEDIYRTRHLVFIEIEESNTKEFVISDNPVTILDMDRNIILEHIPWWEFKTKKFIIFMSLSPKKAIVYTPIKDETNLPKDNFIDITNYGQYLNCTEGVFSNKEEVLKRQLKQFTINQ